MKQLHAGMMAALLLTSLTASTAGNIPVQIQVGEHRLSAIFFDNATSRALVAQFPLTLPMMDLYSREMCYRFEDPLPTENTVTSGYQVGDIVYWAPRHSFVIMYKQNGETIGNLQKVGHIRSGSEIFATTGDASVTFSLAHP